MIWPFRTMFVLGFALFTLQIVAEILKCLLVLSGYQGQMTRDKYVDLES